MIAPVLRPLSIGEIFDRAVTIYVQNFVLFSLILLTVLVPQAFVRNISLGNTQVAAVRQALRLYENPIASFRHPQRNTIRRSRLQNLGLLAEMVIWLAIEPIATCAIAIAVGLLYVGRRPNFSTCFAQSLKSWPRLLGTMVAFVLMFLAVYVAGGIILFVLIGSGVYLIPTAFPLAVAFFVVSAIALIAVVLFLVAMALAGSCAYFSASIEGRGVLSAVAWGMGRIFGASQYRRSVLMALAYFALLFCVFAVSTSIGDYVVLVFRLPMLQNAFVTAIGVLFGGFATTLLAVYYYDIRVRQEGFDLEADLERLSIVARRAVA